MALRFVSAWCAAVFVTWIAAGCGGERSGTEERGAAAEPETQVDRQAAGGATAAGQVSAEAEAILMRADKVDGSADQVISRCAGCALHMPGMSEHALQVGQYEMHFCSDDCKGKFTEETEKAILALTISEDAGGE